MNRRDFLKSSTLTTLAMAGLSSQPVALFAQEANAGAGDAPSGPPIGCGVIGLGERGREVVNTLNHLATLRL